MSRTALRGTDISYARPSLCIHCEAHLKPLYAQYLHNGKLSSSSSRLHALKQLTVLLFSNRGLSHCSIYILAGDEKSTKQQPSLDQIRSNLAISPHLDRPGLSVERLFVTNETNVVVAGLGMGSL